MIWLLLSCVSETPCSDGFGRDAAGACVPLSTDTDSGEASGGTAAEGGSSDDAEAYEAPPELGSALDLRLSLTRSEHMPTALQAVWTGPDGVDSWLEVEGRDERFAEGRSSVVLLAPEGTELVVRAVTEVEGERIESEPVSASTGTFERPLDLPMQQLSEASAVSELVVLLAYEDADARRVVLATGAGELLWQLDDEQLGDSAPVSAQVDLSGAGVLVGQWAGHAPTLTTARMQDNAIWRYGWDGAPEVELATPMAHHLFSQPAPGYVVWSGLDLEQREHDVLPVAFERLVISEIDGDDVTHYATSELGWDGTCTSGGYYADACDVHHANSMDCDLDSELCLYSLHNIDGVFEVSLSGELQADFATWPARSSSGESLQGFDRAHDLHWADDGSILVFNDGSTGAWASRYAVDREAGTLTELWSYGRDDCIASSALGTVQELASGNHLVGFSTPNNLLREVDPDGRVLWELDLGGLQDGQRCDEVAVTSVLGEARALTSDQLGPGVVAIF